MERKKGTLGFDFFKKTLLEYIGTGGRSVAFTPIVGEPLVNPAFFDMLQFATERPEIEFIGFVSNGILLNPEKVDKLLELEAKNISIIFSVGGFDRETYAAIMGVDKYEIVERNLRYLINTLEKRRNEGRNSKLRITIGIRSPFDKTAGPFFDWLRDHYERDLIDFDYGDRPTGFFDNFGGRISSKQLTDAGLTPRPPPRKVGACQFLFTKPIVLADGRVNGCSERDLEAELIIGDLKKNTLKEVFSGEERRKLIEAHETGNYPRVCKDCTLYVSVFSPRTNFQSRNLNWKPVVNKARVNSDKDSVLGTEN